MESDPNTMWHLRSTRLIAAASAALVAAGVLTACGLGANGTNSHETSADSASTSWAAATFSGGVTHAQSVDMLAQDWQYMPGVTKSAVGLAVSPTDFKIVHQDGSGGQPNPPINLYGTHLEQSPDFAVTTTISDITADASQEFYTKPAQVSDEFRIEHGSLRLTEQGNDLAVQVYTGGETSDATQPVVLTKHYTVPMADGVTIMVSKQADKLSITANGQNLPNLPAAQPFSSGKLWFGLDSSNGTFTVSKLNVETISSAPLTIVDASQQTVKKIPGGLQSLLDARYPDKDEKFGMTVAEMPLTTDPAYLSEVISNAGIITLENAMKPQFISPKPGVYDFSEADAIIAIAKKYGLEVHGHTIAFSEGMPAWMRDLPTANAADRASTAKILLDYTTTVATHFKDDLASVDVVNEPFDTSGGSSLQANVWSRALGKDYAATVIEAFHAAAPNVKLMINENGSEQAGDRQTAVDAYTENLAAELQRDGVQLYAIGKQSHVYDFATDTIQQNEFSDNISSLAAQAVPVNVIVSEVDVTDDNGAKAQANQFLAIAKACYANTANNCPVVNQWGVNDRYDVSQDSNDDGSPNPHGSLVYGHDLLIDEHDQPTLAYKELQNFLKTGK